MSRLISLVCLAALCAALAGAQTAEKPAASPKTAPAEKAKAEPGGELPSEATVESFLKHMFGYDPSIQWKILSIHPAESAHVAEVTVLLQGAGGQQQAMRLYVMPDQKFAIAGELMPFGADPFAAIRRQLQAGAHGPARGPANAEVTVVEFSDLECPACKATQPIINRLLSDFPNAHFIFENFPLEQIHPWAFKAAQYAECVAQDKPDAFWKFVDLAYENQESVTPENVDQKMKGLATAVGANADKIAACTAQPQTTARIRESLALGKTVDVTGTPTLFVNGRRIQNVSGVPYEVLKKLVEGTPK
jgi:protein-disulfide isomerase